MISRDLTINRGGIPIRVWLYYPEPPPRKILPVLLVCHGIPGSRPDPSDKGYIPLFEDLTAEGYACATFNFRGCGQSGGSIDMRGWHEDLENVIEAIPTWTGIDDSSIHCIGFSAGGSVAAKVVSYHREVKSLLMMASPQNLADIIPPDPAVLADHFRGLGIIREESFPPDITLWYKGFLDIDAAHWLPFIHPRPVGIVHGTHDETVPVVHAHRLYNTAWEPKRLVLLEGAGHQLRKDPRTAGVIKEWLREVV